MGRYGLWSALRGVHLAGTVCPGDGGRPPGMRWRRSNGAHGFWADARSHPFGPGTGHRGLGVSACVGPIAGLYERQSSPKVGNVCLQALDRGIGAVDRDPQESTDWPAGLVAQRRCRRGRKLSSQRRHPDRPVAAPWPPGCQSRTPLDHGGLATAPPAQDSPVSMKRSQSTGWPA